MDERLFYNLLLRVGAMGKYQYICLSIWSIICMVSGSVIFFNPFLFYQASYTCNGFSQSQCSTMVCSLPEELRFRYIDSQHPTFIDKFGDYRCDDSQLKFIQSIIYISGLVGIILSTHLNTYIRKKIMVQILLAASIISLCLLFFVNNLIFIIVILSINFISNIIISDLMICFPGEAVLQERRGFAIIVLFTFYNLGCLLNGFFFKFLTWQEALLYYFIIPLSISLIELVFYVKETPFDLVTNFTPEEAHRDLSWIAGQNGNVDSHQITLKQLQEMKDEYEENMKAKDQITFHVLDLIRFKSLRMDTICCCALHLFIYYNYSSPLLSLDQFGLDIYSNDIAFSLASLGSSIACIYFVDLFPRKQLVNYTTFASFISILPHYLSSYCTQNCEGLKIAETASIFIFRVLLEVTYQIFYFIQNELFPTQVRSLAILLTASMGNLVRVFIPLIASLNETYSFVLPTTFIISGVIIILATSQIKETLGVPPPQIITQLSYIPTKDQE